VRLPVLPVNDRRQFSSLPLACTVLPRSLLAREGAHLRLYYAQLLTDRELFRATSRGSVGRIERGHPLWRPTSTQEGDCLKSVRQVAGGGHARSGQPRAPEAR